MKKLVNAIRTMKERREIKATMADTLKAKDEMYKNIEALISIAKSHGEDTEKFEKDKERVDEHVERTLRLCQERLARLAGAFC